MTVGAFWFHLMAQSENWQRFVDAPRNRKDQPDSGDWVTGLLMWISAIVIVWVLAYILDRRARRRTYCSPGKLLRSLCRAHGLRRSQWWLLRQIARQEKLEDPARLFLEPELLDPARLGPQLASRRSEILALRARLFAGLPKLERKPSPTAS